MRWKEVFKINLFMFIIGDILVCIYYDGNDLSYGYRKEKEMLIWRELESYNQKLRGQIYLGGQIMYFLKQEKGRICRLRYR